MVLFDPEIKTKNISVEILVVCLGLFVLGGKKNEQD